MTIQTVHVTTRQPRDARDPGECAIIYYVVDGPVIRVTDQDGAMLRFSSGEPCKAVITAGDDPKQVAARIGHRYHTQMFGDRQRGFWRDISRMNGRNVV